MSWFVLVDMGWDGQVVSRFEDENKARKKYEEDKARVGEHLEAVALIEGRVVENEKFNLEVD